jgi:hypothetical protein
VEVLSSCDHASADDILSSVDIPDDAADSPDLRFAILKLTIDGGVAVKAFCEPSSIGAAFRALQVVGM